MIIAISRKYLKKGFRRDEKDEKKINENEIEDMQTSHGSHITRMIYARKIKEQSGAIMSTRERYQKASEDWHRFLRFKMQRESKRKISTTQKEKSRKSKKRKLEGLKKINMEEQLKKMIGEGAKFKEL